ncbi:DUF1906 domain-containing protein [Streptomyces sp. YS-3]|uniref:DUF1906 domain-containing protein n=1 Tax=Streptomyces sp. YS-3 TaxID=3381352 RepID=UPI003862CDD1
MHSPTSIRPWYLGIIAPPLTVATTLAALLTLSPSAWAAPKPDVPAVAAAAGLSPSVSAAPKPDVPAVAAAAGLSPSVSAAPKPDVPAVAAAAGLSPSASAAPTPDVPAVAGAAVAASGTASGTASDVVSDAAATAAAAAVDAAGTAMAALAPADSVDSPAVLARAVHFNGAAFDTCQAPPLATMKAWRSSSYGGVGVYFAGRGRGCPDQHHLNKSWLTDVDRMGWRVLPIFVGSQSPCVRSQAKRKVRMSADSAPQGRTEGRQAAEAAEQLGIRQGSALYLDMEAYDANNAGCARTTLAFVRAWNREVRGRGFLPGFYSSAASGVRHMEQARRAGQSDLPSVMWFARWGSGPSLYGEPTLHADAWTPHRRIHQYAGNVTETHGGRRLVVDRNTVDAPVARFRP